MNTWVPNVYVLILLNIYYLRSRPYTFTIYKVSPALKNMFPHPKTIHLQLNNYDLYLHLANKSLEFTRKLNKNTMHTSWSTELQ